MAACDGTSAAKRRRERRLRSMLLHKRQTVAVELAAALHHSRGVGPHDTHNALRGPVLPSPWGRRWPRRSWSGGRGDRPFLPPFPRGVGSGSAEEGGGGEEEAGEGEGRGAGLELGAGQGSAGGAAAEPALALSCILLAEVARPGFCSHLFGVCIARRALENSIFLGDGFTSCL